MRAHPTVPILSQ